MSTNNKVLGLDIGVTSVGYGIIDLETGQAVDYGVRLFDESNPTENQKRRARRSARRMKSRRTNRLHDMKKLLVNEGLIQEDYQFNENPYEARVKGLTEKLSDEELATALYHLAKLRGSSLEVVEDTNADEEKAKAQLHTNDQLLAQGKYICEIQKERFESGASIRGTQNNFRTKDYLKEAEKILSNQGRSEDFNHAVLSLIARRRDFSDGPGSQISPTPYGRWTEYGQLEPIDLIEKMKGKCSVYPDEYRAAKMTYKADLFNFLNDLNNLTINGEKITPESKTEILAIIEKKGSITPKELAKHLEVDLDSISGFRVNAKDEPILTEFKGYKKVKKVLEKSGLYHDHELVDAVIEELTKNKALERRIEGIRKISDKFTDEEVQGLAELTQISGYHALSAKALNELNEEMLKTSNNQMQILSLREHSTKKLEALRGKKNIEADDEAILSPVAKRAQREALKVVNRLRELYGEFDTIVVETTRAKNSDDAKAAERETKKFFENENKKAEKLLEDAQAHVKLNAKLRQKLRLYEEQGGKTAYELWPIDLGLLISDPTAYEIDHIVPISISLDDSYSNKALVTRFENQVKGNLTPLQAYDHGLFTHCTKEEYLANVQILRKTNGIRFIKKMFNLLYEEDLTRYETLQNFINRNLVDTSYANRVVLNTLQDYFKANEIGTDVYTVKGSATSMFRKRVKIEKDRDDMEKGHAHHAIDALIIASLKKFPRLNYLLNKYKNENIIDPETGEISISIADDKFFDPKYIKFVSDLMALEKDVVKFSYKIDTKPNRQIADETIYSTRTYDDQEYVIKKYKNIYDPKELNIAKDILAGKIDKYLMYRNSPETFAYISNIVHHYAEVYRDDPKIFSKEKNEFKKNPLAIYLEENNEKLRKPSKKGNGPEITSMKYIDRQLKKHINITHKYIDNRGDKQIVLLQLSPYRTDFYYSEGKGYKMVTVRYCNIRFNKNSGYYEINKNDYDRELNNKKIDDSYVFCFSLHHNELIRIVKKDSDKIWRFVATKDDSANSIEVKPRSYTAKNRFPITVGKELINIEKYATDVCGNLYKVDNQKLKLEWK